MEGIVKWRGLKLQRPLHLVLVNCNFFKASSLLDNIIYLDDRHFQLNKSRCKLELCIIC